MKPAAMNARRFGWAALIVLLTVAAPCNAFAQEAIGDADAASVPLPPNTRLGLTARTYAKPADPIWTLRRQKPRTVSHCASLPQPLGRATAGALSGFVHVETAGTIRFGVRGARARLAIGGRVVIDGDAAESTTGVLELKPGWHPLELDWSRDGSSGGARIDVFRLDAAGREHRVRLATPMPRSLGACRKMTPAPMERTFTPWAERLALKSGEIAWADIPWQEQLRHAVETAHAETKPILFWAMNGHPLGCT